VLDAQRQEDLPDLAGDGLFAAQEEVPRDLHRDRAAALRGLSRGGKRDGGAGQALPVHAGVLEEAVVLGRQEGALQSAPGIASMCSGMRRCSPNSAISSPSRL
jgi:hypothetical protein